MDILYYLSELIQTRKAVGISGLGTVFKKKIPGRYDAGLHSFVPPSYTLDFTPELKEETILPNYIGKERNVSLDTANYFIAEFSADILKQIETSNETVFGDLGKLVKTDGELKLVPAVAVNYGFDFYGLPPVKDEQEVPPNEIPAVQPVEDSPFTPEENTGFVTEEQLAAVDAEIETNTEENGHSFEESVAEVAEPTAEVPEPAAVIVQNSPEVEPTLEKVNEENLGLEENPGDDQPAPESNDQTPPVKTNEQQLREEIESLNFYRSKSPYLKSTGPGDEEVILKLNNIITENDDVAVHTPENDGFPVYPAQPLEHKTMPVYLKILLGILILGLMMAAVYFIKPEWFNALTGKTAPPAKKVMLAPPPPAKVYPQVDSLVITDSLKKQTAEDTSGKILPSSKPSDTATVYEIIGASMHDQKEADNFIALMKRSGVDAKVVTNMSGKRLKMSIATLKDEKSAKEELDRLSKKLKIPGIYIYRNKQK